MIVFAIAGKSAAGKDTISNIVSEKLNIPKIISYTTRPPRPGEVNGKDYNFISEDKMMELKNKGLLANYTEYKVSDNGEKVWRYAYLNEDLNKGDCIMVLNPQGLEDIRKLISNRNSNDPFREDRDKVVTLLVEASLEERIKRSLKRDNTKIVEMVRRAIADEQDFKNLFYNYIIDTSNNNIKECANFVEKLFRNEMALELVLKTQKDFMRDPQKFINGGSN